jgi:hypothetical protein
MLNSPAPPTTDGPIVLCDRHLQTLDVVSEEVVCRLEEWRIYTNASLGPPADGADVEFRVRRHTLVEDRERVSSLLDELITDPVRSNWPAMARTQEQTEILQSPERRLAMYRKVTGKPSRIMTVAADLENFENLSETESCRGSEVSRVSEV